MSTLFVVLLWLAPYLSLQQSHTNLVLVHANPITVCASAMPVWFSQVKAFFGIPILNSYGTGHVNYVLDEISNHS